MSQKAKRICKCCGKEYQYCPHCGKNSDEPWRNITDTVECREVLNIVSAYNIGRATKEQVKKVLDRFEVKDYGKYKDSIATVLNNLFKNEDVVKPTKIQESTYVHDEANLVPKQVLDDVLPPIENKSTNEDTNVQKAEESEIHHDDNNVNVSRKNKRKRYRYMDVDSN